MSGKIKIFFKNILLSTFFQGKYNLLIILFSIVSFFCFYIYFACIPDLSVFPNDNNFKFKAYTDSGIGGNSEVTRFFIGDTVMEFDFILKDSAYVHYVGISFFQHKWNHFDISDYNQIEIQIETTGIKDIGVYLYTPNVYNEKLDDICFYDDISSSSGSNTYIIDFDDFKIPNWWFDLTNVSQHEKIPIDLDHIHYFNIGNAYTTEINSKNSFHIYSITFTRDNTKLLVICIVAELLIILSLLVIHYIIKNNKKSRSILIEYKAIAVESVTGKRYSFLDYIHNHFDDCELTLEKLSTQTGINHRRITNHIQQHFDCNFKTYINRIRIQEAKRLLITSELSVGEIAFKVGFNNQSYFNRVFKSIEGGSPSTFRENEKRIL